MITNKDIYPYGYFEAFIMQDFECPQKLTEKLNEPPCVHHTSPATINPWEFYLIHSSTFSHSQFFEENLLDMPFYL